MRFPFGSLDEVFVFARIEDGTAALIRGAGHFASFRHPDQFLHLMLTRVRPAATAQPAAR
ncbi:hypothetical protein ACIRVF_15600 [Kitasatospora sp. NPDC101157]|uniref:hypothetical protein n=1 Tax=Kitasatospora sp. NPDC101157 TaxID=3364098 RepID=UPI0038145AB1